MRSTVSRSFLYINSVSKSDVKMMFEVKKLCFWVRVIDSDGQIVALGTNKVKNGKLCQGIAQTQILNTIIAHETLM